MKILTTLSVLILGAMVSVSVQADQRLRLRMNDHFRGQQVIGLKRELSRQHGISAANFNIVKVRVIAKSKHGGGTVTLLTGGVEQDSSRIAGRPWSFQSSNPATFDRILLKNYRRNGSGAWKLRLKGNIKVKAIVVILEKVRPADRLKTVIVGSGRADKIVDTRKVFRVNEQGVVKVMLKGVRKRVRITKAVVQYRNGQSERMPALEGRLDEGNTKTFQVGGRNVTSVKIIAVSPRLVGSRGEYQVLVRAKR